jgi:putative SOS response-associated peptidase YedK
MCGRYVSPAEAEIERAWHVGRGSGHALARRYNTSPTTDIPILFGTPGAVQIATARWGLIPPWWKNDAPPAFSFNARLEEAAAKPMWRHPLRHSRCLIPAEGWFEWQALEREDPTTGKAKTYKQPHFLRRGDGAQFCFAGLLASWTTPEQDAPVLSCAILTRGATGPVAEVHDRMPVVLDEAAYAEWMDPARTDANKVEDTIRRHALSAEFVHYTVSTAVNNSRSEGPQLVERSAPPGDGPASARMDLLSSNNYPEPK